MVLEAMTEEGYLTSAEEQALLAVPMDPAAPGPDGPFIAPPPKVSTLGENVKGSDWGSEYFAEYVRQWLVKEFPSDVVYGGGLKVYTTLDLNMQKAAYDAVTQTLNRPGDPSAAVVSIDDAGRVRAMVGGTDFANSKVNLATGKAGGGSGRQPGSTFKMFALAEAVREGYSIQSVLPAPSRLEITDPKCLNGEPAWKVRGGPGGAASLVSATKNSINTVYAQLMVRLGPEKVLQMARDMGVAEPGLEPFCALVLGGGQVSVLDMAAGYSTLANNGVAKSPIVVTRVEFPDGRVKTYEPDTKPVLTPEQAGRVTYALRQVVNGGTGSDANIGRPAAGKTGTTQQNVDGWFVGYTPKLTTAVWMGYPDESKPMDNVHGIKVQGGTFPARIWRAYMQVATANTPADDFPELEKDVLVAGETLDPNYGRTSVIIGSSSGGTGGTTQTTRPRQTTGTTVPRSTTPGSTTPGTTAPPRTTVPPTTAPATTAPPRTTVPPTTRPPAGAGTGG
ncbi:MAG: penicillin-binding transpeptidase domain-containing protein [Acidimicrobiales bacterium]